MVPISAQIHQRAGTEHILGDHRAAAVGINGPAVQQSFAHAGVL
eukprot:SAG31_NODE_735_length_12488_cov_7.086044_18_plen_43_part_01